MHDKPIDVLSPEALSARLAAIVASSDDAIISKNLQGIVQSWNDAAVRIFGYTDVEMIGQPILKLLPDERKHEEAHILSRLCKGERVDHFETVRVRKDGQRIDVSVTISPVFDPGGRVVGASKIARDITQFKRMLREREALHQAEQHARAEAERQSRMKDEFLATLSHELRTPLTAILGWSQMLRRNKRLVGMGDEVSNALAVIERNARNQNQMIDDLLDMSRIISGKVRIDVQPINVLSIVTSAVETVRPAADTKGVRLIAHFDSDGATVSADPNRLQQVFWNLLNNAVKFTPGGGTVETRIARVDGHVQVSVTDTGEGIPPEFLPHVFDRFRQADASTTRRHGGLGLGLSIVKQLVELHGGSVRAHSDGPGAGSTFIVSLPILQSQDRRHARGAPPDEGADADAAGTSRHSLFDLESSDLQLDITGICVIVVDDEPDVRTLIRRVLEDRHARVLLAGSAEEAIAHVRSCDANVLIGDIGMPEQDGYTMMRRIRALPREQGGLVPAIALTAYARPDDRVKALLAGFQMHIAKPVEPAELVTMVASLAGRMRP